MTSARRGGSARALAKVVRAETRFAEQSRKRSASNKATQSMETSSLSARIHVVIGCLVLLLFRIVFPKHSARGHKAGCTKTLNTRKTKQRRVCRDTETRWAEVLPKSLRNRRDTAGKIEKKQIEAHMTTPGGEGELQILQNFPTPPTTPRGSASGFHRSGTPPAPHPPEFKHLGRREG